jgi:hypothetical protein
MITDELRASIVKYRFLDPLDDAEPESFARFPEDDLMTALVHGGGVHGPPLDKSTRVRDPDG